MKCPDCLGLLTARLTHGVRVDQCLACGGAWFDAGEFDAVRRSAAAGPVAPKSVELAFKPTPNRTTKRCPRCDEPSFASGEVGLVWVDRCRRCIGLWIPATMIDRRPSALEDQNKWSTLDTLEAAFELVAAILGP